MSVVPVCECPKCSELGLHYMAETSAQEDIKMAEWCFLEEVPKVQWYDGREKLPLTELKTRREIRATAFIKISVVRQCWYCGFEWEQYWKEKNELRIHP